MIFWSDSDSAAFFVLADCMFRFLIACLRFLLTDDQLRNTMMSRDSQTCPKVQTTLSVNVADHLF